MADITIIGNITNGGVDRSDEEAVKSKRIELKTLPAGQQVVNFGVAVNESYTDRQGNRQESVSFFDCQAWRSLAENIAKSLKVGDRVIVTGRMNQRRWENQDGSRGSRWEITVRTMGPDLMFATAAITKNPRPEGATNSES